MCGWKRGWGPVCRLRLSEAEICRRRRCSCFILVAILVPDAFLFLAIITTALFAGDVEYAILNPSLTAVTPSHPHSDASPISVTFGTQSLTGPKHQSCPLSLCDIVAITFSHFLVAKEPLLTHQHHSWPLLLLSLSPSVPR